MKSVVLTVCFLMVSASAQTKAQSSSTRGACSPIVENNTGTLDIHCTNLSPQVAKQLGDLVQQIAVLNENAATQKGQEMILQKIADLKALLKDAMPRTQTMTPDQRQIFKRTFEEMMGPGGTGVYVQIIADRSTRQAAVALRETLQSLGVWCPELQLPITATVGWGDGGYAFGSIDARNHKLANAIAKSLRDASVVDYDIPPANIFTEANTGPAVLEVLITKR